MIHSDFVDFINNKIPETPKSAIILGSGLSEIQSIIKEPLIIPFQIIPNYPKTSTVGHLGNWIFGYINNKPIVLKGVHNGT